MSKFDGSPYTQLTSPARGDVHGVIKDVSETLPENQTKYAKHEDLHQFGSWASKVRSVTASGTVTIANTDPMFVEIDPNGSDRNVDFPAKSDDNHGYYMRHSGSANTLTLRRSGGATITTLTAGEVKYIMPSTLNDFIAQTGGAAATGDWSSVTWSNPTRTGNHTFTVDVDVTALIGQGTKLKYTDTTTKYQQVKSAVYSAGKTTITTYTNTSYVFTGSPSAISYSHIETPIGWPEIFNYTSTPSGTSGGTLDASYSVKGKEMTVDLLYTLGSITGGVSFTLPESALGYSLETCWLQDTGTNTFSGLATVSGSTLTVYAINTSSTYMSVSALSSTVPFTWASTDFISIRVKLKIS